MAYLGTAKALGLGTAVNEVEAADLLKRSAEAGSPVGQFAYGVLLRKGQGVAQNASASASWMERSASAGYPRGMAAWGEYLAYGRGVAANPAKGLEFAQRAADTGEPAGLEGLGNLYVEGVAVRKDVAKGVQLWDRAVQAGGGSARNLYAVYSNRDEGVAKDLPKARRYALIGAERGDPVLMSAVDAGPVLRQGFGRAPGHG